jgi:hypothetical protein
MEGSGPPPAEASQIESLPTVKISQEDVGEYTKLLTYLTRIMSLVVFFLVHLEKFLNIPKNLQQKSLKIPTKLYMKSLRIC